MGRVASEAKAIAWGVVVTAMLVSVIGCKSEQRLARLSRSPKLVPPPPTEVEQTGLKYRQTAGEAIAPVMVQDDPAASAAPAAAPAAPAGAVTLNGHPNGLTRETLNRSVQGSMGALANCFINVTSDPMVAVSFEAEPSGRPSLVRVKGAPPEAESCIRSVMQGVSFPAFEGRAVQVDLPLSFHRVAQPAQATNRGGEQPTAPPLFLQP